MDIIYRDDIQKKALDIAYINSRCGLGISMGVGKTRIGLQHMMKFYNSLSEFLVVAPKRSIFQAWLDEIEKLNYHVLIPHITFSTYLSLNKQDPKKYDCVYLDECHSLKYTHLEFLKNYNDRILGLTGTPPAYKKSEKYNMVEKFCPIMYTFSVDDAAEGNILNDYKIYIHHLRLSKEKNVKKKGKNNGVWYTSELNDYNYNCDRVILKNDRLSKIMRMKSMMEYPTKEKYAKTLIKLASDKKKVIVFANTTKQADRLCTYSFHSKNMDSADNLEYFSDGRINKLSCVLQLSEGVTIPNLTTGIIMHAYGNNRTSAQRIGRLLRLNPTMTANCHILCYADTIDQRWVTNAVKDFSIDKIYHVPVINGKPGSPVKQEGLYSNWPKFK